ncbi:hypothetical protein SDC9_162442 [bioreactor metagenome]|uniref:Uncharacterized protein n=1 Tax=bioreactor metagenome TaxID=1076179 RepID=A0A645FSQ4_9ZZZZ
MKGMALEQPPKGKPAALQGAVLFHRLQRIGRAGGNKPAGRRSKGGNIASIKDNKPHQQPLHSRSSFPAARPSRPARFRKFCSRDPYRAETALPRATTTMS